MLINFMKVSQKGTLLIDKHAISIHDINFGVGDKDLIDLCQGIGKVVIISTEPCDNIPICMIPTLLNGCRLA
jgi:hypothetical protein